MIETSRSSSAGRPWAGSTVPSPWVDRARRLVIPVEVFTGASALVCGGLLAARPDGSLLGLPVWVLEDSPFADWRLPGLLLGGLVGVGYSTVAMTQRRGFRYRRQLSVLAGAGLVVFEAAEWGWLGFHPLQALFMGVGAGVIALALVEAPPGQQTRSAEGG